MKTFHSARAISVLLVALLTTLGSIAHGQSNRLGTIDFPTSGKDAAQPHFIRGVLFLHNFEYDSAGHFQEASGPSGCGTRAAHDDAHLQDGSETESHFLLSHRAS